MQSLEVWIALPGSQSINQRIASVLISFRAKMPSVPISSHR
jgi:hypothetical protein